MINETKKYQDKLDKSNYTISILTKDVEEYWVKIRKFQAQIKR